MANKKDLILVKGFKIYNKMSCVMPFTFNAIDLFVATINGKSSVGAREVCKALKYSKKKYKVRTPLMYPESSKKSMY